MNRQQDHFLSSQLPNRREFLQQASAGGLAAGALSFGSLGAGNQKSDLLPIPEAHFPDRLHLFVWRNWELANVGRLAQVLGTTEERVLEVGYSMGLPPKPSLTPDQLRRIYISVIRQNWHILPTDQLIQLLGWDQARFEFTLREDDFLYVKLGVDKPDCGKLSYQTPSSEASRRAGEIKSLLGKVFAGNYSGSTTMMLPANQE